MSKKRRQAKRAKRSKGPSGPIVGVVTTGQRGRPPPITDMLLRMPDGQMLAVKAVPSKHGRLGVPFFAVVSSRPAPKKPPR
jgi:hypothetical protein